MRTPLVYFDALVDNRWAKELEDLPHFKAFYHVVSVFWEVAEAYRIAERPVWSMAAYRTVQSDAQDCL